MKSDNLLRHLAIPFAIALIVYVISYTWIEHRRTRKGPWEVTFTNDASGAAALVINQPSLGITNMQITFLGTTARTNVSLSFSTPHQVPYELPYGKMMFMDTTFLPGTIVIDLFGHEVQLIPRVLTIDKTDYLWGTGKKTIVVPAGTNAMEAARPAK